MNALFVHRNFPAQYVHIVRDLMADPGNKVAAIGGETARAPRGVTLQRYRVADGDVSATHPFARRFDLEARRAEQVLYALSSLAASGFAPDVVLAHPGWGETLPIRTVFPKARILVYCEFYYGCDGQDVGFDPEFPDGGLDSHVALRLKNAATLLALTESDGGISPTAWQRSTYPERFQSDIDVAHDGIDTDRLTPDPTARLPLPSGGELTADDEVVTFVARNLEPQRGYHIFMRALPHIMASRPQAHVVIIGGNGASYGPQAPAGQTWKDRFLAEVRDRIDLSRVHFLGSLPYATYVKALRVSSAHVYLTYPFVLSWSFLEAMSAGCAVIASDTAPVREVIEHGHNGCLVPFFEPERLAGTVVDVLADAGRSQRMRAAARQTIVERYDLKRLSLPRMMAMIAGRPVGDRPSHQYRN